MLPLFQKLRKLFVDGCGYWYRMWSSWLAVLWGAIVTGFWVQPDTLQSITDLLPQEYREKVSPLVFLFISALPIIVRLLKQNIPVQDKEKA